MTIISILIFSLVADASTAFTTPLDEAVSVFNNKTKRAKAHNHYCVHNTIPHDTWKASKIPYNIGSFTNKPEKRRLYDSLMDESLYDYIRITPYYDEIELSLSQSDFYYVKSILSSAIHYLESFMKVIPINGTLFIPRYCTISYDINGYSNCIYYPTQTCGLVTIPDSHLDSDYIYLFNDKTGYILPQGSGITNTDIVIYLSFSDNYCNTNTFAWASPCIQDIYGRPIASTINICPYSLITKSWKQGVIAILHELTHALVMSPILFDDFIDSDKLYNNENSYDFEYDSMALSNVIFNKIDKYGNNQSYIITNKVKELTQSYFNCYNDSILPGLPIEDDGGTGVAGSHWEEHYLNTEYMLAILYSEMMYVSEFTFALMEDSGWYKVDYNYSEPFYWGHGEGCEWFTKDCIDKDSETSNWPQYFCDSGNDDGCSPDFVGVAYCLMDTSLDDIPQEYQYYVCFCLIMKNNNL